MAVTFVTGGSGFIGRALVRRLIRDQHEVRVLVRSDTSAKTVRELGATPVRGELNDPTTWQQELVGSDVLFHLAAETDVFADRARHDFVTVGGTQAAIDAARHAQVPRFVHCGSEAALLAGPALVEVDETAPLRPDSEAAYCSAKAAAEQIVVDSNTTEFTTVSIRPRFVWGPQSHLIEGLVGAVRGNNLAWIDGGSSTTDVTYVDNAVEGLILGWLNGKPSEAYFITDQHRVTLRDFLEVQFELYGVESPELDLDGEAAAREIPVPVRWFLGQECTLRTDKAETDLGYRPIVSHTDGVQAVRAALSGAAAGR